MRYAGCAAITMLENYLALFRVPDRDEAIAVVDRAESAIDGAAAAIAEDRPFPAPTVSATGKLNSGIVNRLFYPAFVHAAKFYATDACVSCGKCAAVCPLGNIALTDGKPVWGKNCTHCMACICRCPSRAIEYGKHTIGMPRYVCPKTV